MDFVKGERLIELNARVEKYHGRNYPNILNVSGLTTRKSFLFGQDDEGKYVKAAMEGEYSGSPVQWIEFQLGADLERLRVVC